MRVALVREVERLEGRPSLQERLRPIREALARKSGTGPRADKAFYASLYEDS